MDVPANAQGQGGGQDSGVETEGDQESNDSSLSSVSLGNPQPPVQAQPVATNSNINNNFPMPSVSSASVSSAASARTTPEPSFAHPNILQPPPSVTEDGYLGDCSSDGGNEKNFPMPAHLLKRLATNKSCPCHPEKAAVLSDSEVAEPPAGLSFQNLSASMAESEFGMGYQVNNDHHHKPSSRKMKSSLKLKMQAHIGKSLFGPGSGSSERKFRTAVTTNNTDLVRHLLANGVNVNSSDEQSRSALHFAAAKGYSEIVNVLLQNGADPNAKDILGNTALHLAACTNHIEVVTLLLRGGTDVTTIDNSGRTPMQLAQSKLKLLQKNSTKSISEMNTVKKIFRQIAMFVLISRSNQRIFTRKIVNF